VCAQAQDRGEDTQLAEKLSMSEHEYKEGSW
jgi:hypothetical protein